MDAELLVYSDALFVVEQCRDCFVPGYLIVSALSGAGGLEELAPEEQAALGNILALAVRAVKEVVRPHRVYCAQFGETEGPLHFHIFPRTEQITQEYVKENPLEQGALIDGPGLLAWSRRRYTSGGDWVILGKVIEGIREAMRRRGDCCKQGLGPVSSP